MNVQSMDVQKGASEIRELKADELDEVTGGFLGKLLGALATSVQLYNMGLGWIPPEQLT